VQPFRLNGSRVLEVDLTGDPVRAMTGSMVAHTGEVQCRNAGMGGGDGLMAGLKRRTTGESVSLMTCTGNGTVWFAKDALEVLLVELAGETLKVESEQLLALSASLRTDVAFAGMRGASSGQGLFTTTVTGHGSAALLSSGGPPIVLEVSPQFPLVVDPQAFVASCGQLNQTFVTDVSWRNSSARARVRRSRCASTAPVSSTSSPRSGDGQVHRGQPQGRDRAGAAGPRDPGPARRHAGLHR